MDFNEQLQEARKASGLSQEQLAARMNMSRQGISHWENGRALPDAETLKRLSQVLSYDFFEHAESAAAPLARAAEADHHVPGEIIPEPVTPPVPSAKRMRILMCAVCLIAGFALGWVVFSLLAPRPAPLTAVPIRPVLSIEPNQNPVTPVYMSEGDQYPMWMYDITLRENTGIDFIMDKLTICHINGDGTEGYREDFVPSQIGLEDGIITCGENVLFQGGMPVQDILGIRITVTGKDQMGNELVFEEYLSLSKIVLQ